MLGCLVFECICNCFIYFYLWMLSLCYGGTNTIQNGRFARNSDIPFKSDMISLFHYSSVYNSNDILPNALTFTLLVFAHFIFSFLRFFGMLFHCIWVCVCVCVVLPHIASTMHVRRTWMLWHGKLWISHDYFSSNE